MHFTEVCQEIQKMRGDHEAVTARCVYAYMARMPTLMRWGKGTFIHRSHARIPVALIHEIEKEILRRLREGLPFISVSGIFQLFRGRLAHSGVPTETALYSCLRESANGALTYPRYPYVLGGDQGSERLPVLLALEQFVRDHEGTVTLDEIRSYMVNTLCISKKLAGLYIYSIPNVIQVDRAQFTHIDQLNIDLGRLQPILAYIDSLLETTGHVAVTKVFDEKRVTCRLLGLSSPVMLYSLLRALCSERYDVSLYPGIYRHGARKTGSGRTGVSSEVAAYVRSKNGPCSYWELFHHFVDELGYKQHSVYNVRYRDDVVCYSQGTVIHLATLDWSEAKQETLERTATAHLREREKTGKPFGLLKHLYEFGSLPELPPGVPWTVTLLGELLCSKGHFRIIGTQRNAFVPVPNPLGIESLEHLLYHILKEEYGGAANLAEFESDMRNAGIFQKNLTPMMLGDGSLVTIKGSLVVLTELCSDAKRS